MLANNMPLSAPNSKQLRISVSFPDGHFDMLIMDPFYSGMNSRAGQKDCHFIGHLANEPDTCAAMTGCFGFEDVGKKHALKNMTSSL